MPALFLQWLYLDAPKRQWQYGRDLLIAIYHYFSIPLLLTTLFAPWRRDAIDISRLPLTQWGTAIAANFTSRFIGFLARSFVIGLGLFCLFMAVIGFVLFFIVWYGLPIVMILAWIYSLKLIAGGLGV